jgi:hypothetical protein
VTPETLLDMPVHVSLNACLTYLPSTKTISAMMAAMAATSSPYSTAEAPLSSCGQGAATA